MTIPAESFPSEESITKARNSLLGKEEPEDTRAHTSVTERFKTELEAEGKALASQLEAALNDKRGIALRIKRLRAEIEENERAQKALVKRTRSS